MVETLGLKEDLLERLEKEYNIEKKHLYIHLVQDSNFKRVGVSKNDYIVLNGSEHIATSEKIELEKYSEKKYISVNTLSRAMNIRAIEIYKLIKDDIIPAITMGNRILIPSSWHEKF